MSNLKYLNRVLYIAFLNKLLVFFFKKAYYQESYILIIAHNSVVNVGEWLDGSFESQKPSSGSILESPKIGLA
jgi:hypothetical protein